MLERGGDVFKNTTGHQSRVSSRRVKKMNAFPLLK